jgi:hypothetical protein
MVSACGADDDAELSALLTWQLLLLACAGVAISLYCLASRPTRQSTPAAAAAAATAVWALLF